MTQPDDSQPVDQNAVVRAICADHDNDPHRMLDILLAVQTRLRCVPPDCLGEIAGATGLTRIAVEGVCSFYSFLSDRPKGRVTIRLCDDIIDRFAGLAEVAAAFEEELAIKMGQTSDDGAVSLEYTPCIGMCDQAPAAMINDVVLTRLTPESARKIAVRLKQGARPGDLIDADYGWLTPYQRATTSVSSNIRRTGEVLLGEVPVDAGMSQAMKLSRRAVIDQIEQSGLRGSGGAGFLTGLKWRQTAAAGDPQRFIFCNADEGEPGTFKDRVLLTERAHLMIEGMTLAAYAIGAQQGVIYLRGEYLYLRDHILTVLEDRRERGLLGRRILGGDRFDFDIRLQMGAGSYVCGEEGALISSCEGLPGEPRTRPPYPSDRGYHGHPTLVQNVETFCHAARIIAQGPEWFLAKGTAGSHGTKLFSVAGDCARPGVYELEYGLPLEQLLRLAGGEDAAAVQVGGPSGTMVGRDQFDRCLDFDDLATGGAVTIFGPQRNILEIVDYYMSFFVDESCGYCTPCRVGNVFLHKALQKIRAGKGKQSDLDYIREYSATIIEASRCGLGRTSPNPILSTLENFPLVYAAMIRDGDDRTQPTFDIQSAIDEARSIARRRSYIFDKDFTR